MKNIFSHGIGRRLTAHLALVGAVTLSLIVQPANAVILFGSGDPAANTTAPDGALVNSGWQYQGQWGSYLGTPVAPQYFIAARHVGGYVGQKFTFNGTDYTTTAYFDDTNTDLRIWKVDGVFPSYAPLYSSSDELGKGLVVIGRGTQRGDAVVVPVVQTNYVTNVIDIRTLGINKKQAQTAFPDATFKGSLMTVVSSSVVTNSVFKGWKTGAYDAVTRWGQSKVTGAGMYIVAAFDQSIGNNTACLSSGDSSGAVFIQEGGIWKLAGINYGVEGPFGTTSTDSFYGALIDESGLYNGGVLLPNDGQVRPTCFFATRISERLAWIQSVISQ